MSEHDLDSGNLYLACISLNKHQSLSRLILDQEEDSTEKKRVNHQRLSTKYFLFALSIYVVPIILNMFFPLAGRDFMKMIDVFYLGILGFSLLSLYHTFKGIFKKEKSSFTRIFIATGSFILFFISFSILASQYISLPGLS